MKSVTIDLSTGKVTEKTLSAKEIKAREAEELKIKEAEELAKEELKKQRSAEELEAELLAAYREESDPLMAKYLAGEIDKEVWLAKRAEVKAKVLGEEE